MKNCAWCRKVTHAGDQVFAAGKVWHKAHYTLYQQAGLPEMDVNGFVPRVIIKKVVNAQVKINGISDPKTVSLV